MSDRIPGQTPDEEVEVKIIGTPLSEVEPIKKSRSLPIENVDDLIEIVEPPLLRACQILFEKHIQTYESSANKEHIQFHYPFAARLTFDGDQLIPENQTILRGLIESNPSGYSVRVSDPGGYEPKYNSMITFEVPMQEEITAEEIEKRSVDFADQFVPNIEDEAGSR